MSSSMPGTFLKNNLHIIYNIYCPPYGGGLQEF